MTAMTKDPEFLPPGQAPDDDASAPLLTEKAVASHEVAAAAVAAEAEAEVKARVALAITKPRNEEKARDKILAACKRPGFADLAVWERPVGRQKNESTGQWEDVLKDGPSIRLAEECMRAWGNIYVTARVIFESEDVRIVRVGAMDLETNASETDDITIRKTVERTKLRKGDSPLRQRTNSSGQTTFIIAADEGALRVKERAEIAKVKRGLLLQLIPSDLVEEAFELAKRTAAEADEKQLEARRQQAVAAFGKLSVTQGQLELVIKKPLAEWEPADLGELRRRHAALRDGEMSLEEFLGPVAEPSPAPTQASGATQADRVAAAIGAKPAAAGNGTVPGGSGAAG